MIRIGQQNFLPLFGTFGSGVMHPGSIEWTKFWKKKDDSCWVDLETSSMLSDRLTHLQLHLALDRMRLDMMGSVA